MTTGVNRAGREPAEALICSRLGSLWFSAFPPDLARLLFPIPRRSGAPAAAGRAYRPAGGGGVYYLRGGIGYTYLID